MRTFVRSAITHQVHGEDIVKGAENEKNQGYDVDKAPLLPANYVVHDDKDRVRQVLKEQSCDQVYSQMIGEVFLGQHGCSQTCKLYHRESCQREFNPLSESFRFCNHG